MVQMYMKQLLLLLCFFFYNTGNYIKKNTINGINMITHSHAINTSEYISAKLLFGVPDLCVEIQRNNKIKKGKLLFT